MRQGAKDNLPSANIIVPEDYYIGKGAFVSAIAQGRRRWFKSLLECIERTAVTGNMIDETFKLEEGLARFEEILRSSLAEGGKVIFVGNGGSAAIASHMAVDYSKNKSIPAVALNDAPMLTCLANDFGYDKVFSKQIEWYAKPEDVAVIVSSSGKSANIIEAAGQAFESGLKARVTFSGMNPNNKLRKRGNLNFYVPSTDYGLVELAHLALLHSIASCKA